MSDAEIYELKRTDSEFRKARQFWEMIPNCDLRRAWRLSGRQLGFREFVILMAKPPEQPA